tara:strand:- start:210 stop:1082 length:873 start_codon:yes stop_codon:yes gene_type:complete
MFFSIIVPTFNNASLLIKTLNSIEKQTNKDFELIIVDNNSTDHTHELIKKCSIDNLIYKKINNKGIISKSRNLGITISKGKWLIFLDSDDLIYEEKIDFLKKNISDDFDLFCNAEKIVNLDNGSTKIWKYGPVENNFYEKMLKNGNRFSTSASIVKKSFLEKNHLNFNERKDFITAEDYDFFLNLVNRGARVKFFQEILGEHTFYKGSMSSNFDLHKSAVKSVLKYHVFEIQNFTDNKKKLWNSLKWRFNIMDFLYKFKRKSFISSIFSALIAFYNSPLMVIRFFYKKIL